MDTIKLSPTATSLVDQFEKQDQQSDEPKIAVNKFVSEIVFLYEKIRTAMDYRDDEVLLRAAIERILKRRHLFGGDGKKIAEPLLRELVWARYFENNALPEAFSHQVADSIDLFLDLKNKIFFQHIISESVLSEWMYQLVSCHIARSISPNREKNIMSNFMFHIVNESLKIQDDMIDTKNVQMYLAVRRAFAKDDIAFLRYYLFQQIYGDLTKQNIDTIANDFKNGYSEMNHQLQYPLKEKIFLFVKRQMPIFLILEDVLHQEKGNFRILITTPEEFKQKVFAACNVRYQSIASKVRRAIIRSVFFLLLTKVFFAFAVEGTYDRYVYGHIVWLTLILNICVPPLLMIVVSLFIRTPTQENSERILNKIIIILTHDRPKIIQALNLSIHPKTNKTFLITLFTLLWIVAFIISFGGMYVLLSDLGFNPVSKAIFIFFVTIVSFLSYRINLTAHVYSIGDRQRVYTPFVDFLFLPIIRVGMKLTEGVSKINVFIFIFDFLIEAPFKGIFSFFEQWFLYLHTKREDLE